MSIRPFAKDRRSAAVAANPQPLRARPVFGRGEAAGGATSDSISDFSTELMPAPPRWLEHFASPLLPEGRALVPTPVRRPAGLVSESPFAPKPGLSLRRPIGAVVAGSTAVRDGPAALPPAEPEAITAFASSSSENEEFRSGRSRLAMIALPIRGVRAFMPRRTQPINVASGSEATIPTFRFRFRHFRRPRSIRSTAFGDRLTLREGRRFRATPAIA